jgi:hypothetical protein
VTFFVFSQKQILKTNDLCAKKLHKFKNSQDDRLSGEFSLTAVMTRTLGKDTRSYRNPILTVGIREPSVAAGMPVPKASLNLDDRLVLWQNNVWAPRQVTYMQPKSEAKPMKRLSDKHFRFGVFRTDTCHIG